MAKNKRLISGLLLITAALIIIVFSSTPSAGSKEVSISDLVKEGDYQGEYVTIQGVLKEETVKWNAEKIELRFEIADENHVSLPIYYEGIKPDNFSEGMTVLVEGFMDEKGMFDAEKIQTKCPSKYEGEDTENYDPKTHKKF